ncbi:MAG: hypothetical protein VX834_03615 [Myxococcota bacterium]|nr:hypothetical protein [Myxococcota bacterium]
MQATYTTKAELRATPYRDQLQVPEHRLVRYHSSSGSTGDPTVMAYTQADLDLLAALTARAFEPLYGHVSAWRVYNAFGYGLFTGGLSFEEAARHAREHLDIPMSVVPASNQPGASFEAAMAQHRRSIELFEPTILCATPSMAFALWEEGLLEGFEAVITGGEPSSAALRALLKGLGERVVIQVYGLSEIIGPGVAQSCRDGGLHLNEDAFGVEFLEDELVLSTRHNEAMPRVRYRTGDAVTRVSCTCGNTHPSIEVHGRDEDFVTALGLYLSQLEDILVTHGYSPCFQVTDQVLSVEPLPGRAQRPLPVMPLELRQVMPGTHPRSLGKSSRMAQCSMAGEQALGLRAVEGAA